MNDQLSSASGVPIAEGSIVSRSSSQMSCELDRAQSEVVVLNTDNNQYFGLEQVSGRIWQLLTVEQSVGQLVETLVQEFDVSKEQCLADTLVFLESAQARGLVQIRNAQP